MNAQNPPAITKSADIADMTEMASNSSGTQPDTDGRPLHASLVEPTFTDNSGDLAALFKAAADPLRLEVLRVLSRESFSVQELCVVFDAKQSGMSHHLKVLANAELVSTRREGNFIFYHRNLLISPARTALCDAIFAAADQLALSADIEQRLAQVQEQRAELSKAFFAANADKFAGQQELIATFEQYSEPMVQLLDSLQRPQRDTVLEIGPGEGAFLQSLSHRFRQVIAVDNSEEMLARAQQQASEQQLHNLLLIHGDTQSALQQAVRADCVVVNMVLHHTPSPAAIFQDIHDLLLPGGSVLISELCHHDQNWVREACGDIWQGFEPEDLTYWADAAGLESGQALYLALRNGFRFQLRQFIRPGVVVT